MYPRRRLPAKFDTKAVCVARTIETPQPQLQEFLEDLAGALGHIAAIKAISGTRITLFESGGLSRALQKARQSQPHQAEGFSYWMSNQLNGNRGKGIAVKINPDKPLGIYGRNENKLAFNLVAGDYLTSERARIEALLLERFGEVPPSKKFKPHVTIGRVNPRYLTDDEHVNPELLIPEGFTVPDTVALNGLKVYLDGRELKH